ncbi:unnamed protein product [Spirodela intermedia]|nr:unnamed protein product [Spirodela intermedia]CAA6673010.1 unnamed protein product [Spirodela intermedia]
MGIRRCFAERQRRTRSEDRESSVEVQCTGEVLVEMFLLVRRLNEEGYLKSVSFSQGLDPQRVPVNGFVRGVLMTAAQRFGEDHQEIAKWLSGSSLKKVALSGCPCTERKTVFAAKRLRSFFCIQEDVICRGCPMKNSCKFANHSVSREHKLTLADAMRVLTAYACGYGAPQALKSQELCLAVGRSLKEVISLAA